MKSDMQWWNFKENKPIFFYFQSLDELSEKAVPTAIKFQRILNIEDPLSKYLLM